jgi:hypothetical protein
MTPTTDLQKPFSDWRLKTWAEMGPWQCIAGANSHVFDGTIVDSSYSGIAFVHATRWDDPELGVTPSPSAELIAMAPDLAARVLELEATLQSLVDEVLDLSERVVQSDVNCGRVYDYVHVDLEDIVSLKNKARAALKGGEI